MVLFPMGFVLRVFPPSTYLDVRLGENTCAALPIEKITHLCSANMMIILSMQRASKAASQNLPEPHFGFLQ